MFRGLFMSGLKNSLKKIGFINWARSKKWKKHAKSELFSQDVIAVLEKNPKKIGEAIDQKLNSLPDKGESIIESFEQIYSHSPLSERADVNKEELKQDMFFWHFAYGFTFNEYACYQFFDKGRDERRTFLSDRDAAWMCYDMNDLRKMSILADKAQTYERFGRFYHRDVVVISNTSDFEQFEKFIKKHKKFIKKNTRESCGRSVELIDITQTKQTPEGLFNNWIAEGKTIIEELVIQSNDIAAFNSSSVNTLRCITFRTKKGVETPFFFFKTGRNGAFVDNGAAGGLIIAVDWEKGILGAGTDEYGHRFDNHPDSGISFIGFQLPDWDQAVDLCRKLSAQLPEVRIIGWDLAHTDNGWVIIEGNSMTEWIGPQSTWLRGIRDKVKELYSRR